MKNQLIIILAVIFLFGSAFVLIQTDKQSLNNSDSITFTTKLVDMSGDAEPEDSEVNEEGACLSGSISDLFVFNIDRYTVNQNEATKDCTSCRHEEICIDGKCVGLLALERQSMFQFDNACAKARCNAGEVCVAGQCYQLSTMRDVLAKANCLNTECKPGQTCYRGVCHDAVDESGRAVQCAPGEATELYAPPSCLDGYICAEGKCVVSDKLPVPRTALNLKMNTPICGSGMARVSGSCVSFVQKDCGSCNAGEVCLGGDCYELTRQMGDPCQNVRCSAGTSCVSGICVKQ